MRLVDLEMAHELGDCRAPVTRTRGERIAALERHIADLAQIIQRQAHALGDLAALVMAMQNALGDDTLPGENPLARPRARRVRPN